MRGIALGAALGLAAMVAAAPASARAIHLSATLTATGSVAVTWHGDRARGCGPAGLCGYRGSTSAEPVDGQIYIDVGRNGVADAFGYISEESASLTRVQRREPSGAVDSCVDATPGNELDIDVTRGRGGTAVIGLAGEGVGVGRCAGPDLTDVLLRLPRGRISFARLRRGATTIDMRKRVPFHSGRFSGMLTSTVRMHVGRMRSSPNIVHEDRPPPARRRLARVVSLHEVYRVTRLTGKVAATFHGLAAPACNAVDACGVSGAASWTIGSTGGFMVVEAGALARSSDRGRRGLLAAIRRPGGHGFVGTYAALEHGAGVTSVRVDRSGGTTCRNSQGVVPPYIEAGGGRRGLRLVLGSPRLAPAGPEVLRAGCPGPTRAGVTGRSAMASARLPLSAITGRTIVVPLVGGGHFGDGAYRGAWRSSFTLGLQRVKERLTYRYRRVPR